MTANSKDTTSPIIQHIPFHEDELYAIVDERTGKEYVLPKPMADMFGLAWNGQLAKFRKSQLFSKGMQKMCIPSPGGEQEAILLERRFVHAWLLSIDAKRLPVALQEKLLRYQEECADVLDAYFTKGVAVNPRGTEVTGPWDTLAQMVESGRRQALEIHALKEEQDRQKDGLIASQQKAIEALQQASLANNKADIALEEVHRTTVEVFILGNKLLPQFPMSEWGRIGAWLGNWCSMYNMEVLPVPVVGKPWGTENSYPLPAFAAWLRMEQRKPHQVSLAIRPGGDSFTRDPGVAYGRRAKMKGVHRA